MCASWAKTGLHFQNVEWPPIRVDFKQSNVERAEPIPEDQHKVKGGRFTTKGAKKARPGRKKVDAPLFGE